MAVFETVMPGRIFRCALAATLEARPDDELETDLGSQRSLKNNHLPCSASIFSFASLAMLACLTSHADAAQCGSSAGGYEAWKQEFAGEARAKGVSASTVSALMATNYAQATINADRGQRSF